MTEQYLAEGNVSSDGEKIIVFCGAQIVRFEDVEDPEIIWDSVLAMTLAKNKKLLDEIKRCKVTMCSSGGNRNIKKECNWTGVGKSYLNDKALTNIVS